MTGIKVSPRNEANAIVYYTARDSLLEDIHSGKPLPKKYQKGYSRISQNEMKQLMIEMCDKMEYLIRLKQKSIENYNALLIMTGYCYCQNWKGHNLKEQNRNFMRMGKQLIKQGKK
jgi:hypothetical protein